MNKINGRTPEEIKRGLECCINWGAGCAECPYDNLPPDECVVAMKYDNLEYIQQLEATRPKWISVDERLPGYGAGLYFIVCLDDGKVTEGRFEQSNGRWYQSTGEELWEIDVTHWMHFPEPPQEET